MKKLALVLVLAALAALVAVQLASTRRGSRREGTPRPEEAERHAGEPAARRLEAPSSPSERDAPATAPPAAREALRPPTLRGGLLDPGAASPALLTWTPLLAELEGVRSVNAVDFERLRATSLTAATDARGEVVFPVPPEGWPSGESVLWITRAGREARSVVLDAGPEGWRWPAIEAAAARAPVRVVVRRAGEPVAGASVRHTLSFWEAGETEEEKRSRRVFLRDFRTGPDGSTAIVPGGGENLLLASAGGELSFLWAGEPEEEIVLELRPTIEVSGHVTSGDPGLAFDEVRYSVGFFSAEDRSDLVWAGSSHGVGPDGRFGPDAWPRGEGTRVEVRVAGGALVPAVTNAPNPPAGGRVAVELAGRQGHPFVVSVATPEGTPLQGVAVRAAHRDGSEWLVMPHETTGEDGRAAVQAPGGFLALELAKPGYASVRLEDERLLVPQARSPFQVVLRPAGVVEGWVHQGSEPVKGFWILAWNEDKTYHPVLWFEDEEGAFRLEDVPEGETVRLYAFTDALPQSETASVVLADEPVELELELPTPRRARGRVLDALTREPLPSAAIQHLVSGMGGFAGYRGQPQAVQPDGSFELGGFLPGRGGFACTAEGYETLYYHTRDDDVEVIDVGLLALNPLARLEVRVRDPGVSDYSGHRAWNANAAQGPLPLARDGTLSMPARTGWYRLHVARPDGDATWVTGTLLPGERKRVELDLAGGVELVATLADPPAGVEGWTLGASTRAPDTDRWAQARWSAERAAFVLRALRPGPAVLELRDGEGQLVVQRSVELADARQQTLQLALGGEQRRLRLVDPRGRPWSTCAVTLGLADGSGWSSLLETDARGELVLGPTDARRVIVSAHLGSESIAYGVAVDLEPDPGRTTVVPLEVGPRSLLRLSEEGRPVAGLHVLYTHDLAPRHLQFSYVSDEAGLVRGPFLGPGTYTVRVNHRDFWPTRHRVARRDVPDPLALELHARSTLAIEVTTPGGLPVPGARLALEHAELAESAEAWLAAGSITLPEGLVADEEGRLVLEGIPRGTYAWTCATPGGASASGELRLAPRERRTLAIRLVER